MPIVVEDDYELPDIPHSLIYSPDGVYMYCTGGDVVYQLLTGDMSLVDSYDFGSSSGPDYLAISSDGAYLYSCNGLIDTVSKFQTSDMSVVGTFTVTSGDNPYGCVIDGSNDAYLYVTTLQGGDVHKVATSSMTASLACALGEGTYAPSFIAWGADGHVYVGSAAGDDIKKIRTSDMTVVGTCTESSHPGGMDTSPSGDMLYVSDLTDDCVYKIRTSNMTVVTSLAMGTPKNPDQVRVSPDGAYVYTNCTYIQYAILGIYARDMSLEETLDLGAQAVGVLPYDIAVNGSTGVGIAGGDKKIKKAKKKPPDPTPTSVLPFLGSM